MSNWRTKDIEALKKREFKKVVIPAPTANQLTQYALKVLSFKGWHVWRQNQASVWDPTKKVFRRNSSTPGISDVIGFNRSTGQFIAVEVKVGRDKLRPEQEQFLADVAKAGGVAAVVRSANDVDKI